MEQIILDHSIDQINPTHVNPQKQNWLHIAAKYGSLVTVQQVIKKIIPINPDLLNQPDEDGKTPLHYAVIRDPKYNSWRPHQTPDKTDQVIVHNHLCEEFLQQPNIQFLPDHDQKTPLDYAINNLDLERAIWYMLTLHRPKPVQVKDKKLQKAINFLLSYGLIFACEVGDTKLFRKYATPDQCQVRPVYSLTISRDMLQAYHYIHGVKPKITSQWLIETYKTEPLLRPAIESAICNHKQELKKNVKYLIKHGPFVLLKNLIHHLDPDYHLTDAIHEKNIKAVQLFLEDGVDVNKRQKKYSSHLIHAIRKKSPEICHLLHEHGAQERYGPETPYSSLYTAIENDSLEIGHLLVQYNSNTELELIKETIYQNKPDLLKQLLYNIPCQTIMKLSQKNRIKKSMSNTMKRLIQKHIQQYGSMLKEINKSSHQKLSKYMLREIGSYL